MSPIQKIYSPSPASLSPCSPRVVAGGMAFALQRTTTYLLSEVRDLLVQAIAGCHGDSKNMWFTVNRLQPDTPSGLQYSAADLAAHFTTKVEIVRSTTINAPPPVINLRQSTTFADIVPVSVEEAAKLLKSAPNKHCQRDQLGY